MDTQDIKTLSDKIKSLRIAVYGDFTLDAYWVLDPRKSEISVETGLQAEAVGKQNFSLGGAANVVDASPDDIFPAEKVRTFAENLYKMYSRPVFISRGNRGLIAFDKNGYTDIPGLQFLNKTDSVGTGDTMISALACSLAVGIASDEVRRHGLNPEKRVRLVRAGAHIIIPDFSQAEQLLNFLF